MFWTMKLKAIVTFIFFINLVESKGDSIDFKPCIVQMTNGCSIPLNLPFPYKEVFLPACERHDICYQCGQIFNWTRSQCDHAFQANMLTLCKLKEDAKHVIAYDNSFWEKLRSIFKVATSLANWILIKSGTLEHCVHGSDVYFKGVDGFGHSSYGSGDVQVCSFQCAGVLGDPRNVI